MTPANIAWLATQFPSLSNIHALARGGQKQVFSAQHGTHGDVVLKLMLPGSDLERVRREIDSAAKLRVPRMPQIFECGSLVTNGGSWLWLVEARVPGESLRVRLKRGPLAYRDVLILSKDVSESLAAAEAASIVHRDVKPDNIMMDPAGRFWLIDFGIARHLDKESITATHMPFGVGTPGYAPAEQTQNVKRDIDARADLFALGVTLFEAATGGNPHIDGARDLFERNARAAQRPLPRLPAAFPAALADYVATLAQPSCVHRPQSAREAHEWAAELCRSEGI